jgi:effector-binding domain-containing protein
VPAGKALVIDYYGSYEGIGGAHMAMDEYVKSNNLKQKSPVLEQYITDPETEPDTSKWLTKVIYLLEGPVAEEQ